MQLDKACCEKPVLGSLSIRPACRRLDKFNQDLIRRTVFALHNEKKSPVTLGTIQEIIKDSIEISKPKLIIALN